VEGAHLRALQEPMDETLTGEDKVTPILKHGFRSDPE